MYLAVLLLICAAIILFNIWRGWRGGALAQLFTLGVLLVSYGAAAIVGHYGVAAPFLDFIPRLMQPYVLGALVAILLYSILGFAAKRTLYRMDAAAALRLRAQQQATEQEALARGEQPPVFGALDLRPVTNSSVNRRWGGALGAVKGMLLAGVLLVAIQFLGSVAVALGGPPASPTTHNTGTRTASASHGSMVSSPDQPAPSPVQSLFQQLGHEIKKTPVGAMANAVSPVKQDQIEAVGKLSKLAENPEALERFRLQPQVQEWAKNPRIRALSKDPVIAKAVKEQRWTDLLNAPAVIELSRDPEVRRQFQSLNLDELTRKAEQEANTEEKPRRRHRRME